MDTKYKQDNSVFYVFIISSNPQANRVQIIIHSFDQMNNIRRYTTCPPCFSYTLTYRSLFITL